MKRLIWRRVFSLLSLSGLLFGLMSPANSLHPALAASQPLVVPNQPAQTGPAAPLPAPNGPGGKTTVTSAADPYLARLDKQLQAFAKSGGDQLIDVIVYTRPGAKVDWKGYVQALPLAMTDPVSGLKEWYGKARAVNLVKMASLSFVVRAVYNVSVGQVPRFRDPDFPQATNIDQVRARVLALRSHPVVGPQAPTSPGSWWDVGPGHNSKLAWDKGYTGTGVTVADIDSGVDFCHPDLNGTWATYDVSKSQNRDYTVFTGSPALAVDVNNYYDYFDGWPLALSPFSNYAMIFDLFFNGHLTSANTFAEGASKFADTSATGTGDTISFDSKVYTTTGTASALNPIYHIGYHPDSSLHAIYGERVAVLVVDEDGDGVYDHVYVDLNDNHDFRDDKPVSKSSPAACADLNGDGYNDISGGLVYYIADGLHWPQMMDWYWDPSSLGMPVPASGSVVAFMHDDPLGLGGAEGHGTLTASNIVGQGVIDGDPSTLGSADARPTWKPMGVGGMVQGGGKNVKLIGIGDIYINFTASIQDAWYFSTLGVDGNGSTNDGANVTSNSYGESNIDNDEWDSESRLITFMNTSALDPSGNPNTYGQRTAFLFATGNGGPGFGTNTPPSASTAIKVGASTQFGSTDTFEKIAGPNQITWGEVIPFSDRGPTSMGHLAPDVTGDGAFAAGDLTLNGWGDGKTAWESWGGTSRSTPVAAGNLALVYQAWHDRTGDYPTWDQARQLLMSGTTDRSYDVNTQGAGDVNADFATDIAGGRYGLALSPDAWYPGNYRGTKYPSFASILPPGGSDSQLFTAMNYSGLGMTAPVTVTQLTRTGEMTFTLTTHDSNESSYSITRPDYLFDVSQYAPGGVIPAGTNLMTAEILYPFNQFEPQNDNNASNNNNFRVLWLQATDLNANGRVWSDTNHNGAVNTGELEPNEINRLAYGYGVNDYNLVATHDPLSHWGSGIYLGLAHRTRDPAEVPSTNMTIRVSFYKRTAWSWVTLGSPNVSAPASSAGTFSANIHVPANTPYGLYDGEIEVHVPAQGAFAARTSLIPIEVNVAFTGDLATQAVTLGGISRQNTQYDNGRVTGPQDWSWRAESGDWRFYFMDQTATPPLGTFLINSTTWDDPAPNTDLDTLLFGPTADGASFTDPARFGPYTLAPIGGSVNQNITNGVWGFQTATGTNKEYVVAPLTPGLNEMAQHTTRWQGATFDVPFTSTTSSLALNSGQLGPTAALTYTNYFTDAVSISSDIAHTGGLTVAVFGTHQNLNDFPNQVIHQDPTNSDICDFNSGGIYTHTFDLAGNVSQLTTNLFVGTNDLDLYVLYDSSNTGHFNCPDDIIGSSTQGAGLNERVSVSFPPAGHYMVLIQGFSVSPDPSLFDWNYSFTSLLPTLGFRNADLALTPAHPARLELFNVNPGACDAGLARCDNGLMFMGFADAPNLIEVPITVNFVGPDLTGSDKLVAPDPVLAGGTLTYTLDIQNGSPVSASVGTLLTDTLPAGLTFGSLKSGGATYNAGLNAVLWNGAVPTNSTHTIVFTAIVQPSVANGTVIQNYYDVNNGQGHVITIGPASTTVHSIDLTTSTKAVNKVTATPGDTLAYSLQITNSGPVAAAHALLTDTLPAGVSYVNGSVTGGGTYNGGLNAILWTGALAASGGSHTVAFQVRVNVGLNSGDTIQNAATLDTGFGNVSQTNTATTTGVLPDLSTSSLVADPIINSFGPVPFTVLVQNSGQVTATAMMTDEVPAGLTLNGAQLLSGPGNVIFAGDVVTWTGNLDAAFNSQATIRILTHAGQTALCQLFTDTAHISDAQGQALTRSATVGYCFNEFLPVVRR